MEQIEMLDSFLIFLNPSTFTLTAFSAFLLPTEVVQQRPLICPTAFVPASQRLSLCWLMSPFFCSKSLSSGSIPSPFKYTTVGPVLKALGLTLQFYLILECLRKDLKPQFDYLALSVSSAGPHSSLWRWNCPRVPLSLFCLPLKPLSLVEYSRILFSALCFFLCSGFLLDQLILLDSCVWQRHTAFCHVASYMLRALPLPWRPGGHISHFYFPCLISSNGLFFQAC